MCEKILWFCDSFSERDIFFLISNVIACINHIDPGNRNLYLAFMFDKILALSTIYKLTSHMFQKVDVSKSLKSKSKSSKKIIQFNILLNSLV